jgi:hypothetical protein
VRQVRGERLPRSVKHPAAARRRGPDRRAGHGRRPARGDTHGRPCVERADGDPWRSQGALKLVVDQDTQEILGAQMVGPESTEVIAQVVLAMEAGIGYRQLLRPHHLHPFMAEVVGLAIRLDDLARNA